MRVAHRYVEVDGHRTHLLHGEGPISTLFVHGAGGSAWTFEATLDALAIPGWASVDLLGYGESSWLADGDYSSARQSAHLRDVLDQLDVGRLSVVGFSWGGLIALGLARDTPVDKLVVIDVAPSSELPATQVPAIPDGKAMDPRLLHRWQFREEDHWDTWRRNTCETLLVRGEQSPVLSRRDAQVMLQANPQVSFVEIPDTGHLVPLEQPRALAGALTGFLC